MQAVHISLIKAANLWLKVVGSTLFPQTKQIHKVWIDKSCAFDNSVLKSFLQDVQWEKEKFAH